MTVEELMARLAAMPPESKVIIGIVPASWSFLQATQVNLVGMLWQKNAVFLRTPLEGRDVDLTSSGRCVLD